MGCVNSPAACYSLKTRTIWNGSPHFWSIHMSMISRVSMGDTRSALYKKLSHRHVGPMTMKRSAPVNVARQWLSNCWLCPLLELNNLFTGATYQVYCISYIHTTIHDHCKIILMKQQQGNLWLGVTTTRGTVLMFAIGDSMLVWRAFTNLKRKVVRAAWLIPSQEHRSHGTCGWCLLELSS